MLWPMDIQFSNKQYFGKYINLQHFFWKAIDELLMMRQNIQFKFVKDSMFDLIELLHNKIIKMQIFPPTSL